MIKNKELIYLEFFQSKKKKLYYNQIKESINLSHSSLQIVLKKLVDNGEIIVEKTKSNIYYELTNKFKSLEFTKITLNLINNLNLDVKIIIKEFQILIPTTIYTCIFFGSASRKEEQVNSDIDLIVILDKYKNNELQRLYEKEIKRTINEIKKELESRSLYSISIVFTNKEEFEKQNDYLIKEATNTGFPIINQMNYYDNK